MTHHHATRLAVALAASLAFPALAGTGDAGAALREAFGGEALQAISRFDYRLQVSDSDGKPLRDAEYRLLPASGQLWQRDLREGSENWWDGAGGWRRDAEGRWLSLGDAAASRLSGHVASHFFRLLRDPATRVDVLDAGTRRLVPSRGAAFTVVLDGHGRIAETRFDDGTVARESDYVALDGAWWPRRFAVRAADGTERNGVFSALAVSHDAAALPDVALALDSAGDDTTVAGAARRLAPGLLSTPRNEYNLSESTLAGLRVFARSDADFRNSRIWLQRRGAAGWLAPEPAPLHAGGNDSDPWLTPDGRWLYFVSDRPAAGRDASRRDFDLWRLPIDEAGRFGDPEHLGEAVNSPAIELGPELHDGVLYFNSARPGGPASLAIYRAALHDDGTLGPATAMPSPFNDGAQQGDFTISPDGRIALFWSVREGAEGGDLFAVRRRAEGWEARAIRLPAPISSAGFDFTPAFRADGGQLRFASERAPAGFAETGRGAGGLADLYVVDRADLDAALPPD